MRALAELGLSHYYIIGFMIYTTFSFCQKKRYLMRDGRMNENILEAKLVTHIYGEAPNEIRAIDDIDFSVIRGEFVSIVGSSGSGKTTLLNIIGGLLEPTTGDVIVNGTDIYRYNDNYLTIFRRKRIGFVFQSYNLVPILNVYDNITLPIKLDKRTVDQDFFEEIVDTIGISEKLYDYPYQLSGGQQQRVAIARALITKPTIVLADEPTGNLDSKTGEDVLNLLTMSAKKYGQTIVLITHNTELAGRADRIITLEDGRIAKDRS
jgi:putative ABC transport system ATP-binding protein